MDVRVQIFVGVITLISLIVLVNLIRKKSVELRYVLIWLFVGVTIFIINLFPRFLEFVSILLGVASPINLLFFIGFVFSLAIIFSLTIAISRISKRVKELTQELALLEKKERDRE